MCTWPVLQGVQYSFSKGPQNHCTPFTDKMKVHDSETNHGQEKLFLVGIPQPLIFPLHPFLTWALVYSHQNGSVQILTLHYPPYSPTLLILRPFYNIALVAEAGASHWSPFRTPQPLRSV